MSKSFRFENVEFVTNNYAAILSHTDAPSEYHVIQDFLKTGPFGYALTNPEEISASAVLQIWRTAKIGDKKILFQHDGREYEINSSVIEKALKIPGDSGFVSSYPDNTIRSFIDSLGYNGDTSKLGKLVRAKLRKEWNFFFDCIGKCFTNKCSNFDALTQLTQ